MFIIHNHTLRLAQQHDIPHLLEYVVRNREYHKAWSPAMPESFYTIAEQTHRFNQYVTLHQQAREYKFVLGDEDSIIAVINLVHVERGVFMNGRLGYSIDELYSGKQVMTECIERIKDYSKNVLQLHRLEANIMPRNIASKRVIEKCGFTCVGLSPQYLLINKTWEDHEHWAVIL